MNFTVEDSTAFDHAAFSDELIAALGSNYGISSSGNIITTNEGEPDQGAFQALLDAHVASAQARESAKLKAKIKNIRAVALEWFTKNSGIATVYDLNYEAALLGASDTTTILRNNKTPAQHLTDFGQYLEMTGEQFGAYVLDENQGPTGAAAGVKMSEIEGEYLRVYYSLPTLTESDVEAFQSFCDARIG